MRGIDIFCTSQASTSIHHLTTTMDSSSSSSSTVHLSTSRLIDRHNPIITDPVRNAKSQPSVFSPTHSTKTTVSTPKNDNKKAKKDKKVKRSESSSSSVDVGRKSVSSGTILCAKGGDFISPAGSTRYLLGERTSLLEVGSEFEPVVSFVPPSEVTNYDEAEYEVGKKLASNNKAEYEARKKLTSISMVGKKLTSNNKAKYEDVKKLTSYNKTEYEFDKDLASNNKIEYEVGKKLDAEVSEHIGYKSEVHSSKIVSGSISHRASSSRSFDQVVVLRVSLHCKGCASKVRKHISRMQGVTSFNIDFAAKKVTVVGNVTPLEVLTSISKVKTAQLLTTPTNAPPTSSNSLQSTTLTTFSEIYNNKEVVAFN